MQSYNCHLFHQPGRIWHGDGGGDGGSSSFPLHGPQLQDALSQCHHHECDRIKLSKDNSAAKEAVRTDHITGRGSRRRVKSSSLHGQPDIKRDGTLKCLRNDPVTQPNEPTLRGEYGKRFVTRQWMTPDEIFSFIPAEGSVRARKRNDYLANKKAQVGSMTRIPTCSCIRNARQTFNCIANNKPPRLGLLWKFFYY